MKAWHFMADKNGKPVLRDGTEPPAIGVPLRYEGPVVICKSGLHASRRIIDALRYAPGSWIARVDMREIVDDEDDKIVGRERTILQLINADRLLHEFALKCAEYALRQSNVIDERCWNALKVKRRWLDNKATDDELAIARTFVQDTSWTASRTACWSVCWAIFSAICGSASRASAMAADGAVSWAAFSSTSSAIFWTAQNRLLVEGVNNAKT